MKKKQNKYALLRPRLPTYKLKPEQVHKSKKSYRRKKDKKTLGEILKKISSGQKMD